MPQYQGFADVNMGRGAIVIGLAAIIIGDVVFGKIFKNFALKLLGAVLGGVIYYIVITFVLWLGLPQMTLKCLRRRLWRSSSEYPIGRASLPKNA